jgi:hypothetical protein
LKQSAFFPLLESWQICIDIDYKLTIFNDWFLFTKIGLVIPYLVAKLWKNGEGDWTWNKCSRQIGKELRTFLNMKNCLMYMIDRNPTLVTMFQSTCILQVHLCFTWINFFVWVVLQVSMDIMVHGNPYLNTIAFICTWFDCNVTSWN